MNQNRTLGLSVILKNELNLVSSFILKNNIFEVFDEICFLDDFSKDGSFEFLTNLKQYKKFMLKRRNLNFNFSEQRNHANTFIKSDYIARLDLDEIMNKSLINWIEKREFEKDFYTVKRKELFEGKFLKYTDTPFIFKNSQNIFWINKIHEVVVGHKSKKLLPKRCQLIHDKNKSRCEKQNHFYFNNFSEQRKIVDELRRGKK